MVYVWGVDQVSKNSEFLGVGEESHQCGKQRIELSPCAVLAWDRVGGVVPHLPNAALCFRTATFAISKTLLGQLARRKRGLRIRP